MKLRLIVARDADGKLEVGRLVSTCKPVKRVAARNIEHLPGAFASTSAQPLTFLGVVELDLAHLEDLPFASVAMKAH